MKEIKGDLIKLAQQHKIQAIAITTNGVVKKDGKAVMGAGIALLAKQSFPGIDDILGYHIKSRGNHAGWIGLIDRKIDVFAFPVKHHFREPADLELIEDSCKKLVRALDTAFTEIKEIGLPRPGCGAGKLKWKDVKPVLEKYFDDRFVIVDLKGD